MKRILAMFLTLALLAGMLPSVAFAAGGAADGVLVYEFTLSGAGEEITEEEKASDEARGNKEKLYSSSYFGGVDRELAVKGMGNDDQEEGCDWSYVGTYGFYKDTVDTRYVPSLTEYGIFGWLQKASNSNPGVNGLTLKINVPEPGEYIPKINIAPNGAAANYHIALVSEAVNGKSYINADGKSKKWDFESDPGNSTAWAVDVLKPAFTENNRTLPDEYTYLLKASFTESQTKDYTSPAAFSGSAVSIDAGNYYLVISLENGTNAGLDAYINSFELVPVVKVTDIEPSVSPVMVGSKIVPGVIWKNGDRVIDGSTGKVTVEIAEDKDGVLVSDGNGNVYAKAEGTARVRVTGTLNETSASAVAEVTVYADGGYAGVNSYSYLFTSGAYEDSLTSTGIGVPEVNEQTFTESFPYQDYGVMRPWGLVAATASHTNSAGKFFAQGSLYLSLSGDAGDWAAFKIKVPKPGKYTIDASGYTYSNGGLAKIFMLPYNEAMTYANIRDNIESYMSDENFAAKADFNGSAAAPVMQTNIGSFTAEPSLDYEKGYTDYLMIIESNDSEKKSGTPNVLINTITLVGTGGIANAEVTVDEPKIGVGEYTGITNVVAKNSADNVIDLSDAYIAHSVAEDDRDILEICDDGKTFKAIGEGNATIETLILIDGSAYVKETEIFVSEDYNIISAYLYAPSIGSIGRELVPVIRLEQRDRTLLSAGEIVGYEIVSQTADNVIELDDDGKKLIGAGVGTAEIKARVRIRGIVHETDAVAVSVGEEGSVEYPLSFKIDLRQDIYPGDTAEKLHELVKYTEYRNWIFHAVSNISDEYPTIGLPSATASLSQIVWKGIEDNSYLAFKVKIPAAGNYEISTTGYSRNRAAKVELYIMPATEDNIANLAAKLVTDNEFYGGAADTYRAEATTGVTETFGKTQIENPGEYLVVFKAVHGTAAEKGYGDAWYPLYISFTNTSTLARAELSLENGETKMEVGTTAKAFPALFSGDDEVIDYSFEDLDEIIFKSSDKTVAAVDENGNITALNEGTATITAIITYENITVTASFELEVEDTSGIDTQKGITVSYDESIYIYGRTQIKLLLAMNSGKTVEIPGKYITWNVMQGADAADIAEDGTVTGKAVGKIVVSPVVSAEYKDGVDKLSIPPVTIGVVWDSTINPAIYTIKERENAKLNASRYSWAKKEVEAIKQQADKYVENLESLYERMVPEGLPRYYHVGHKYDPQKFFCRQCGCNIGLEYGSYAWNVDMLSRPWKIQCPDCKRLFPSNDFGSFYELGITESGAVWSYAQALQKHHELFVCEHVKAGQECTHERPIDSAPEPGSAEWIKNDPRNDAWKEFYGYNVAGGYLTNDMYKDIDKELGITGWAVDDGFGYHQPFIEDKTLPGYDPSYYKESDGTAWYSDGTSKGPVQHTYIAYYLHEGLWHGSYEMIKRAISTLTDAFVYTGDAKYGRAGAILLDRVADFYPSFNWKRWDSFRGDGYRGKILDPVWENAIAKDFARAYDAFIPIYNDPYLAEYLSKKSPRYEMDENGHWKRDENGNPIPVNLKNSPGALRKHVEDNILLELYDATVMSDLAGNFGMTQTVVVAAAVALNRLPETAEMLEWVMKPGTAQSTADNPAPRTGGATMQYLIEQVDRDGNGNENAPGYNRGWVANLIEFAELLSGYELYPSVDLFKNARFINMFDAQARLTLGGYYGTQTGDSGAVASRGIVMDPEASLTAFRYTGDRDIARALYMYNGDTAEGLRGSILDDDPEKVTEDIERIVEEDGEYALESDMMTGYGFAALRAGAKHNSASSITETNTNRDFAIYFGASGGHGHKDGLNLFASAFGLNVAPDIGYPEQTGDQPNRYEWVETTISHNTVIVDENEQEVRDDVGTSHHFDDSGRVKLMDISKDVYEETDDYRRSMIMVEVDDEISYGVDFFHINGGNDHMYSFHSQSDEISAVSGLSDMTETPMYEDVFGNEYGTYAGADVKYGPDPGGINNGKYPRGYTWLRNIRTFNTIEKDFSVEFKVKDWNKVLPQKRDIRLRLTMVNDDPMEEVTFAMAYPPRTDSNANIGNLEYLLVRNKGSNLNTTFTTVLEPYEAGNKYIKSIEKLPMERQAGTKPGTGDSYGAVRVELENGRIDYIIYSTNSEIDYIVDGNINFRGFAGVISFDGEVSPDAVLYSYLNDGEVLKFADEEKEEALAAYTGTVKSYTDELKMENSIVFTPTAGQTVDTDALSGKYVYIDNDGIDNSAYRIESAKYDGDDVVLNIGTVSVIRSYVDANDIDRGYVYNIEKGQSLRIPLSAITSRAPVVEQPDDYTVSAGSTVTIPINAESMSGKVLTLIGTTLPRGMSINQETKTLTWKPDDSQGGENHVAVTASDGVLETTVHFTVTVYGRTTGSSTSTDNSGTSGGGGGGAAPIPDDSASENTGTDDTQNTEKSPEASGETDTIRFTDLSNHAWAEDAINTLAADGIIKGTSASTYSPAKNITRADFALLLVRAFKLESENAENFADVAASDYFAAELAIARNNGIISGIGDNKYAPRNTITRQDMMVIVHRALTKLGVELESADVDYGDFTSVAEYAQDAVEALITSGLVNGKSGKIAPTDYTTRAEVAVLIKRILDYIK